MADCHGVGTNVPPLTKTNEHKKRKAPVDKRKNNAEFVKEK